MKEPGIFEPVARDRRWKTFSVAVTDASAVLVTASFTVIACGSFAALIFNGPLGAFVARGIWIGLFTALVVGIVVALASSYAGAIAIPQDRVVPILALMAGTIASGMGSASAEEKCLAVMGAIAIVSLATGAFLFALGWLRLGNLIRYIPLSGDRRTSCWLRLAVGSRRPACDDGTRSEF